MLIILFLKLYFNCSYDCLICRKQLGKKYIKILECFCNTLFFSEEKMRKIVIKDLHIIGENQYIDFNYTLNNEWSSFYYELPLRAKKCFKYRKKDNLNKSLEHFFINNRFFKNRMPNKFCTDFLPDIIKLVILQFNEHLGKIIPFTALVVWHLLKISLDIFDEESEKICLIFVMDRYTGIKKLNLLKSVEFTIKWWELQNMKLDNYYDVHYYLGSTVLKIIFHPSHDRKKLEELFFDFKFVLECIYKYYKLINLDFM